MALYKFRIIFIIISIIIMHILLIGPRF